MLLFTDLSSSLLSKQPRLFVIDVDWLEETDDVGKLTAYCLLLLESTKGCERRTERCGGSVVGFG